MFAERQWKRAQEGRVEEGVWGHGIWRGSEGCSSGLDPALVRMKRGLDSATWGHW